MGGTMTSETTSFPATRYTLENTGESMLEVFQILLGLGFDRGGVTVDNGAWAIEATSETNPLGTLQAKAGETITVAETGAAPIVFKE